MVQRFKPRVASRYIGSYRPRIDGWEKASGTTKFADDLTIKNCFPGMLSAKVLTSPYPHARIKHIDTSKAAKLSGVKVILTYEDPEVASLKPTNSCWTDCDDIVTYDRMYFPHVKDRRVLSNEAYWAGDEVGVAVAAESERIAEDALKLIDIEWEVLPFVMDPEEAMKEGAPIVHPEITGDSNMIPPSAINFVDGTSLGSHVLTQRGDLKKAFAEADVISEVRSKYHNPTQGCLDNWCCLAKWEGDKLTVWSNSYAAWQTRTHLSEMLEIPLNKVRAISPYNGGQNGRCDHNEQLFFLFTTLLAKKARRPVKFKQTRRESFNGGRDAENGYCKIGAKKDGKITALHINIIGDAGAHAELIGAEVDGVVAEYVEIALAHIPCVKAETYGVYTNKIPGGCRRGIGYIQANFLVGLAVDALAEKMGIDPIELVIKNFGDDWGGLPNKSIEAILKEGTKRIGWEKRHKPGDGPVYDGTKKRGMGFSVNCSWHPAWCEVRRGPLQVIIKVSYDGTVCLEAPTVETGPGSNTCCVLSCAETLGVRPEDINWISTVDTETGVRDNPQTDSAVGHILPEIVHIAALDAKRQILERAAPEFGVSPNELDINDGWIHVKASPKKGLYIGELFKKGTLVPIISAVSRDVSSEKKGTPFISNFAEVEVDTATGAVEVIKLVVINDAGTVMYASGAEAQQIGGQCLAAGEALMEEIVYDQATGIPLNFNLIDYKIPTIVDFPTVEPVLMEVWKGAGEYGASGIGENVVACTPRAIANAVYNAIGVRVDELPITPNKVLKALGGI